MVYALVWKAGGETGESPQVLERRERAHARSDLHHAARGVAVPQLSAVSGAPIAQRLALLRDRRARRLCSKGSSFANEGSASVRSTHAAVRGQRARSTS